MNLIDHLTRQQLFSAQTFGPGTRLNGVTDHIRKELVELGAAPSDLELAVLSFDQAKAIQIVLDRATERGQVQRLGDPLEWVDVVLLAFDGFWRSIHEESGGKLTSHEVAELACRIISAKQTKNEGRSWPDWRTQVGHKAIQHVRGGDDV